MTSDEVYKLIEDNGLTLHGDIEHFAALVIKPWADQLEVERKKFQELNDIAVTGMQHARIAEREACADNAEHCNSNGFPRVGVAAQIRARGHA